MHHPSDATLGAYAAGLASPGEALLVACHLTLCPRCRRVVEDFEALGGASLAQASAPIGDADALLAGLLDRLDEDDSAPVLRHDPAGVLPGPLVQHVGPFDTLAWRWRAPAVEEVVVPVPSEGMPVRMFRGRFMKWFRDF